MRIYVFDNQCMWLLAFRFCSRNHVLESELAEKPLVFASLVAFLELALDLQSGLLSLCLVLDNVASCDIFVELNVDKVSGWHEMSVIVALDEGLNSATLFSLFFVVFSIDGLWISFNAGNNRMTVALVRISIIVILQDDCLSSSISAGQYDDHLAWLHNFPHDDCVCLRY